MSRSGDNASAKGRGISRRGFGKQTISAALLSASAPINSADPATSFQDAAQPDVDLAPLYIQEVDARWKETIRRYGERLSDQQQARVRRILLDNEKMLRPVREFALANEDAPATSLKLVLQPPARGSIDKTSETHPVKNAE